MTSVDSLLLQTRRMPLVAILRGLDPAQATAIGEVLLECGFRTLEVPLNRPGALESIARLVHAMPEHVLVGGGTVLTVADVDAVHGAGGRLIVSPNCDPRVIAHAVARGMMCAPGVATPSEAFTALHAGAHALKIFPAEMVGHAGLKAFKSVLPATTDLWPVGGITPQGMADWCAAGATGFGIGSQLYAPGAMPSGVLAKGHLFVQAWRDLQGTQD